MHGRNILAQKGEIVKKFVDITFQMCYNYSTINYTQLECAMRKRDVETERLNLYLPKTLVEDLRRYVPGGERTRFVAETLAQALRRLKLRAAIEASAGAWSDEAHPELDSGEDIDRWIEEGRAVLGWDRAQEGNYA